MSSLATSSLARIDHRTVFKNLQTEPNKNHNDSSTADIFNPLNNKTIASYFTKTKYHTHSTTLPQLYITSPRTYAKQRSDISNLAHKTKIPYPLATLWSKQKPNHFKRSTSLRTRGTKSNLPLIMEPTTDETPTKSSTTVNEEKARERITESVAADGLPASARRKLVLTPQTDGNVAETTVIKRSSSLRRNFRYNSNSFINNKTDNTKSKLCAAKNLNSALLHDVTTTKEQCDDIKATTTATPSTISASSNVDKQTSAVAETVQDFSNMSLNHNGVTTLNATIAAASTTTTATTTITSLATAAVTQQTRPLTLNTPPSATNTTTSKGLKSPKTPQAAGGGNQATSAAVTPNFATPSNRNITAPQSKTSPGSKLSPKTPPVTPDSPTTYLDDDLDSLFSYGTTTSGRSTMSCEHAYVARNGTTFSGRKMKYMVHCSNYAGQVGADYLTPTQRAQRQLRRLKEMLSSTRRELEKRDSEIVRLTHEVFELRLFKASLSSPDERSASSDAVTVREAELKTSQDVSPIVDMVDDAQKASSPRHQVHTSSAMLHQQHLPQSTLHHQQHNMLHLSSDMQSSFADSGHFEDMTSSSVHSKDSSSYTPSLNAHDQACDGARGPCSPNTTVDSDATVEQYELQRQELIRLYEQRIEDLIRNQDAATSEMKRTNCDRIEALLQKLAECNTRYADIVPDYEHAKERIRELEKQLEELQRRLAEHEEKQKQMYLHMYQKGQEAERIARADQALELAHRAPENRVSINELLHQLQSTQDELENIRAAECRKECGNNHALLTAKEAISLWILGARKTIYRRLLEAQKNRTHVDPEVTLQFLKSAIYYFLTDKENSQGHLQAIESILEFSEAEKQTINKARSAK